jgi:vacuolar-type H+-ATPase subunit I/STV1
MKRNQNTHRLVEEATQTLKGWCERRGNYTETYLDKDKLVELVVLECCKKLTEFEEKIQDDRNSDYAEGWITSRRLGSLQLKEHFGLNKRD